MVTPDRLPPTAAANMLADVPAPSYEDLYGTVADLQMRLADREAYIERLEASVLRLVVGD